MFEWLRNKFTKKYEYGSISFHAAETSIYEIINKHILGMGHCEPVSISVTRSNTSNCMFAILIYKTEVK